VIDVLYGAAWALARPFAALAPGTGKLGRALRGRFGAAAVLSAWSRSHRTSAPLVWFHAASVGEGRQAEAVLARVRALRPDWQIACTHASASAERLARSLPADVAGYLPADTPRDVALALDALRPAALVFAATDLWPVLIAAAARRGVGLGLVSGTLAPTSSRRGALAKRLLRPAYQALDRVGAIDQPDADGLAALGVARERLAITGDTRHDSAAARAAALDRAAPHLRALAAPGPPIVVAGSTWDADEAVMHDALPRLWPATPIRLVVAPHEPTEPRLREIEAFAGPANLDPRVVRLSALEAAARGGPPAPWDVCVVDRVGVLADLYALAHVAFVGGGFHRKGLHSVIEPAALGIPVLFGPEWRSSRDARLLLDAGAARAVENGIELARAIGGWLASDSAHASAGRAARAVVEKGLGAAERSAQLVIELVETSGLRA